MANIFKQQKDYVEKPNRNQFDLSHSNNLTFNFGELIPIECRPVFPGDTIDLDMSAALKFMPMTFPVQTPIKLNVEAFYVRSRTLWDNFMNKITSVDTTSVTPFIRPVTPYAENYDYVNQFFGTGSLSDYLGIPSTISGYKGIDFAGYVPSLFDSYNVSSYTSYSDPQSNIGSHSLWPQSLSHYLVTGPAAYVDYFPYLFENEIIIQPTAGNGMLDNNYVPTYDFELTVGDLKKYASNDGTIHYLCLSSHKGIGYNYNGYVGYANGRLYIQQHLAVLIGVFVQSQDGLTYSRVYQGCVTSSNDFTYDSTRFISSGINTELKSFTPFCSDDGIHLPLELDTNAIPVDDMVDYQGRKVVFDDSQKVLIRFEFHGDYVNSHGASNEGIINLLNRQGIRSNHYYFNEVNNDYYIQIVYDSLEFVSPTGSVRDVGTLGNSFSNPFSGFDMNDIKINALPFRAYEAIYNAYYRNERVDPLIGSDNRPLYNKYVVNSGDGADTYPYTIHHSNWDLDFLTSAVASPQLGVAPLVGVQGNGDFIFRDQNNNQYTMTPLTGSDGDTIVGIQSYSEGTPIGSLRLMMDSINQGISISDFRNVNSFQRYLERAIRRGLKYVDVIKSQFGTDMKYKAVDMPEFIGGFTQMVSVNQVNQTMDTVDYPLGSYAGQANIFGKSSNHIHHYCDEHGYLIVIARVQPYAMYSQILPKHFLYRDTLDWFAPAFNHISMQPILYNEVCPLQVAYFGDKSQTDTFGYQRPWYDLISAVDEVHGEFRTTLRNFTVNRVFSASPELGRDFIQVNADDLNDVFSVNDTTDKIIGSFYFDEQITRSISKISIPSIE